MRFPWHFLLSSPEDNFLSTLGWKHLSHSRSRCRFPRPKDEPARSRSRCALRVPLPVFRLPRAASHGVINYTAFSFSSAPWPQSTHLSCSRYPPALTHSIAVPLALSISLSLHLCLFPRFKTFNLRARHLLSGSCSGFKRFPGKAANGKDRQRSRCAECERAGEEAAADRDGELFVESLRSGCGAHFPSCLYAMSHSACVFV